MRHVVCGRSSAKETNHWNGVGENGEFPANCDCCPIAGLESIGGSTNELYISQFSQTTTLTFQPDFRFALEDAYIVSGMCRVDGWMQR